MPQKLKVVSAFLLVAAALAAIGAIEQVVLGQIVSAGVSVFGAGVNLLLFVGLRRGSEGARTWLLFASYAELLMSVGFALFAVILFGDFKLLGAFIFATGFAYCVAQAGYTIWALKQRDVVEWMFQQSTAE